MPSTVYASSPMFEIHPMPSPLRKQSLIGAEVILRSNAMLIDPAAMPSKDRLLLQQALYDHSVLVVRNQKGIEPDVLPKLAAIWDDQMESTHSGGAKQVKGESSVLSRNNGERIPRAPQVQIIGHGHFKDYEGIKELNLRHVNQSEFHARPLSTEAIANGETRFYRWHMDTPLYERQQGPASLIHSIQVPCGPSQRIVFDNGKVLTVSTGATAFVSGAKAFQLLSPEEQEFALNTTVQYAPRPYDWIRDCKATSDGITISSQGKERPLDDLPPWTWEDSQAYPMAWKNPGRPSQPHLQIAGCCVFSLQTTDPKTGTVTVVDDLAEARGIVHSLQKKVMAPEYVYAHDWREGDLVVFHNKGVWHSITGNLEEEKRLLWQCTMGSKIRPEAAR